VIKRRKKDHLDSSSSASLDFGSLFMRRPSDIRVYATLSYLKAGHVTVRGLTHRVDYWLSGSGRYGGAHRGCLSLLRFTFGEILPAHGSRGEE
jgi:hypothetical protein